MPSEPDSAPETRSLLEDGSLTLKYAFELAPLVERWMPRLPEIGAATRGTTLGSAEIEVRVAEGSAPVEQPGEPTLRLGTARAWIDDDAEQAVLVGGTAGCRGVVDLQRHRAEIEVTPLNIIEPPIARDALSEPADLLDPTGDSPPPTGHRPPASSPLPDLYSMLTISAALLVGRLDRALIHAAATVRPDGTAWLIAGDARTGKSTTCANLLAAGWDYVSDDQVVLSGASPRELRVEGWPRDFHLDEGWERRAPSGERRVVEASSLGSGRWRRAAPLHGVLLPYVARGRRTELQPARPGDTLVALVRQAPWLMADRSAAPRCLDLLRYTAARPAFRLALGPDTFRDPERLVGLLEGGGQQA